MLDLPFEKKNKQEFKIDYSLLLYQRHKYGLC